MFMQAANFHSFFDVGGREGGKEVGTDAWGQDEGTEIQWEKGFVNILYVCNTKYAHTSHTSHVKLYKAFCSCLSVTLKTLSCSK